MRFFIFASGIGLQHDGAAYLKGYFVIFDAKALINIDESKLPSKLIYPRLPVYGPLQKWVQFRQ